jgi:uncharacterized membrane protein HdeD (DUF308 family)
MRWNLGRGGGLTAGPVPAASGGSSFVLGVILFLLGVLGLLYADVWAVASIVGLGILLVAGGLTELSHAFRGLGGGDRFLLSFLSGLLSIVVGAVLVSHPAVGVTSVGLLIGAWLFATGLFRGVTAIVERYRYWGWDVGYGFFTILLGFWVTGSLPTAATRLLGSVIALELMARSVAVMGASLGLQRAERSSAPAR